MDVSYRFDFYRNNQEIVVRDETMISDIFTFIYESTQIDVIKEKKMFKNAFGDKQEAICYPALVV